MSFTRRIVRIIWLTFLIALALSGLAIGAALSPRRERDYNRESRIELIEEHEEKITNIQGDHDVNQIIS